MFLAMNENRVVLPKKNKKKYIFACHEISLASDRPYYCVQFLAREPYENFFTRLFEYPAFVSLLRSDHIGALEIYGVTIATPPHVNGSSHWRMDAVSRLYESQAILNCRFYRYVLNDGTSIIDAPPALHTKAKWTEIPIPGLKKPLSGIPDEDQESDC